MSLSSKLGVVTGSTIGVPTTFALEVLGAAGAVWGSSEVLGLRDDDNNAAWNTVAIIFGVAGLIRYSAKYVSENSKNNRHSSDFCSAFWHAIVSPHEAVKDEFFYSEQTEKKPLLLDA